MTEQKTPRSVRLNAEHRADIINAVMDEFVKQNPPPSERPEVALLKVVAELAVNSAAAKRTKAVVDAGLWPRLKGHVNTECGINASLQNPQGENVNTMRFYIPVNVAKEVGLPHLPDDHSNCRDDDAVAAASEEWISHEGMRAACVRFIESKYPTVIVHTDSPEYVAIKGAKKARHEWDQECARLRRETTDLLQQFASTKQVRESWPDLVPYLPAHIADPEAAVKLPTLATSRLSERLGIKS